MRYKHHASNMAVEPDSQKLGLRFRPLRSGCLSLLR